MNIASSKKYVSYRKLNNFWAMNGVKTFIRWLLSHGIAVLVWAFYAKFNITKTHDGLATLLFVFGFFYSIILVLTWIAYFCTTKEPWGSTCDKSIKIIERYFFNDLNNAINTIDINGVADLLSLYGEISNLITTNTTHKYELDKTFEEVYKNALNTITESKEYEDLTIAMLIKAGTEHKGFDDYTESKTLKERYSKEYMRDTYPRLKRTYDEKYIDLTKCEFWKDYTEYFKHMHLADIDATAYMLENRYKYLKEHRVDNLEWTYSHILHPAMRIEDYTMTQTDTERRDA
jgi:hypothetical protein